jgi:hypothetical protein
MSSNKCPEGWNPSKTTGICMQMDKVNCYLGDAPPTGSEWEATPACAISAQSNSAKDGAKMDQGGVGGGTGGSGGPGSLAQCSDLLMQHNESIINNIKNLQAFEQDYISQLQELAKTKQGGELEAASKPLITKIYSVGMMRKGLFKEAAQLMRGEQCSLANDRYDLANQMALLQVAEQQLQNIEANIAGLKDERNSKQRMVEITRYEADRYRAYKLILRNVAFCALGIVASIYLINIGWETIGKLGVIISIVIGLILTAKSSVDAWGRSNMDWQEYEWPKPPVNGKFAKQGDSWSDLWKNATCGNISNLSKETSNMFDKQSKALGKQIAVVGSA